MIALKILDARSSAERVDSASYVIGAFAPSSAWVSVDVSTKTVVAEAGAVDQRLRHVAIDQVRATRRMNGLRKIRARAGFADLVAVAVELPGRSARIVTLARLAGEAPFDHADLRAVRSKIQALRSRKRFPPEPDALASIGAIQRRAPVSALIVDRDLVVVSESVCDVRFAAARDDERPAQPERRRLPVLVEHIVREAIEGWPDEFGPDAGEMVVPFGAMVLRLVPMRGRFGDHIGIFTERARSAAHLEAVAARFQISSRELEVARLLIKGRSADEVGIALNIAETTVAAHVRNIIAKTKSRNRTEAIAKLLGR